MSFDLAVLGTGPGGYVAAIKAAQAGLRVAVFDKRSNPGGTCLNVGCIPSKTLLHATEVGVLNRKQANLWAQTSSAPSAMDFVKLEKTRVQTIDQLGKGIQFLFKKNKITPFLGKPARLVGPDLVECGGKEVKAKNIIIATGSAPAELKGEFLKIDEKDVLSSTGALALTAAPKKLLVVGGGVIGLELASVFARLGSQVEVIEFLPAIGGVMDASVSTVLRKILEKQGLKIHTGVGVTGCERIAPGQIRLTARGQEGEKSFVGDKVLVAVGRRPVTKGLNLRKVGVKRDALGRIEVNEYLETCVRGIRAIGDCIPGPMLAHKAEEDAMTAVQNILGHKEAVDYSHVPGVVYTHPEVAQVGLTEQDAKAKGLKYKTATFPMMANSRSKCNGTADGLVKIIADPADRILGASIVGDCAGEIITELTLAIKFNISAKQLGNTVHPHPTVCEAVKEACMAVSGKAIHM